MACLTCSRALRAQVLYVLRCQRALRASVPCMLSCSRDNVSYVPSCLCVPTRSCAITSNMKNIKFSMTCFSYIFGIFSLSFSCEIKLYLKNPRQAGMSPIFFFFLIFFKFFWELRCTFQHISYQAEIFNECYDEHYFFLSILRAIFKWLINSGKWIIMDGS